MSGFSIDWLDLRENADQRARDTDLRQRAMRWLTTGRPADETPLVVDLGSGTGSTLRALTEPDQQPVIWRLVDHDATLLDEARRRHGSACQLDTRIADLSRLDTLPLDQARLVTASALFDLVSDAFVEALAAALKRQCQHRPVGLYSALNYDGTTSWTPAHPLDEPVLAAFNQDQQKDKGFGPALGPKSGEAIHSRFTQAGFAVWSASSPWVLDGADATMVDALIDGIASAVTGAPELDADAVQGWVQFRKDNLASGTCVVGHSDLLALPA